MKKYKQYLLPLIITLATFIVIYFTGQIILPFLIGLFGAYLVNPLVVRIQKKIPNRNISVSLLLVTLTALTCGCAWLFGSQIINDSKRLNNAFVTFLDDNNEEIDETSKKIKSYIEKIYPSNKKNKDIFDFNKDSLKVSDLSFDSLNINSLDIDSEKLKESLSSLTSFFSSGEDKKTESTSVNWLLTILYSSGYFIYIMYTFTYFEDRFTKYFGNEKGSNKLDSVLLDFQNTIIKYFRQRSIVVLICSAIFITTFSIVGIPGAIILGLIAGVLCYIAHFHYVILLPTALSCWVLSIEQGHSFFLYFGLIAAVLLLISALEELVFFPKIMTGVASMNPAIMLISLSFWSYVFGAVGIFIALPLTTLVLLYLDRMLMERKRI